MCCHLCGTMQNIVVTFGKLCKTYSFLSLCLIFGLSPEPPSHFPSQHALYLPCPVLPVSCNQERSTRTCMLSSDSKVSYFTFQLPLAGQVCYSWFLCRLLSPDCGLFPTPAPGQQEGKWIFIVCFHQVVLTFDLRLDGCGMRTIEPQILEMGWTLWVTWSSCSWHSSYPNTPKQQWPPLFCIRIRRCGHASEDHISSSCLQDTVEPCSVWPSSLPRMLVPDAV